jgi:hypothetical protein
MTVEGWWYSVEGRRFGPVARDDVLQKALAAAEGDDFLVWTQGLSDWRSLKDLDALHDTLSYLLGKDAPDHDGPAKPAAPSKVTAEAAASYIARCIAPQREWYDRKARNAKRLHYFFVGTQMLATTSIPFVNYMTRSLVASTSLAVIAAAATGFSQILRVQQRWIAYRSAASALEALQLHYELRLPPFDGADCHDKLIVEGDKIIGEEGAKWMSGIPTTRPSALPSAIALPSDN